jgi:hypothetical protein
MSSMSGSIPSVGAPESVIDTGMRQRYIFASYLPTV